VQENGDPDIIQVRRTFKNKESALMWEAKVLQRIKVVADPRFLNRWDNNMVPINLTGPFPFEDPEMQKKVDASLREKYGSRGMGIASVKEKVYDINTKLYGIYHTLNLEQVKAAREAACLSQFGVTNPFYSKEFQDSLNRKAMAKKASQTLKELYIGKDWSERNAKSKSTNLGKYGVSNPANTPENSKARKDKCIAEHGVDNYAKTEEFKQRMAKLKQACPYGCGNMHLYDPGNFSKHMTKEHNWDKKHVKNYTNQKNQTI
jgi:hypothetical protein